MMYMETIADPSFADIQLFRKVRNARAALCLGSEGQQCVVSLQQRYQVSVILSVTDPITSPMPSQHLLEMPKRLGLRSPLTPIRQLHWLCHLGSLLWCSRANRSASKGQGNSGFDGFEQPVAGKN
ncbi:MAG: hypothetical protein Q8M96_15230, partial [Rubrivivax sp.]|nr:hypothetical protein [Rubrivivax sp.]